MPPVPFLLRDPQKLQDRGFQDNPQSPLQRTGPGSQKPAGTSLQCRESK
jgi:hypothetical protein